MCAKAGIDKAESADDIRQAQKQLGHASVTMMTEIYVRERKGDKTTPTK
ncbi:phage-related integrase [Nitrosomonas eutropha C91]|uniref:Phage-related integrase n=1 Tax=Nitrosomonas eutropha (strain DSM 101675 / C91 / Nm57) TaxID=335283 RepID=Q0AJ86_NITEC|nr:phage-related integrase [Nitrosomonas eutropha C91]